MIEQLYLLTNNDMKLENAKNALLRHGIFIEQLKMIVPEIQSADVSEVAEFSARYAGEKLSKPVIKVDVAFEIRALNGFPGPFVKYINQWLTPEKILQLMENATDRYAQFVDCVSLYEPNSQCCRSFISNTPGRISDDICGENGWGIDKIFIPDGYDKTLASYSDEEKAEIWKGTHWRQLAEYLLSNANHG